MEITAKEKAQEIVEKYIPFCGMEMTEIQCAIIAVNEILDVDCKSMNEEDFDNHIEYWEAVKQELMKSE